jgi:hypothetical protein
MIARVQWSQGEISETIVKVITVPATVAAGVAIVSRKLSSTGMK